MYSACYNVLNLFEMNTKLVFIRYQSYVDFCKLLGFEAKVEVDNAKGCTC